MAFKTMYPAVAGSPTTTTGNTFVAGTTTSLTVSQGSVLASAPNLATITAGDGRFVTVSYTSKSGNTISGLAALEGDKTGTFATGSIIARRYSAVDDSAIKSNLEDINTIVSDIKAENKQVYVSTTGSDTTGDGTQSKPWGTIGKAVSMYPYNSGWFTINVESGEYNISSQITFRGGSKIKLFFSGDGTMTVTNTTVRRPFWLNPAASLWVDGATDATITMTVQNNAFLIQDMANLMFRHESGNINFIINCTIAGIQGDSVGATINIDKTVSLTVNSTGAAGIILYRNSYLYSATTNLTLNGTTAGVQLGGGVAILNALTTTAPSQYSLSANAVIAIGGKWKNQ